MSVPQADIEKLFKASEGKSSNREKQIPINLSCLYPLSAFCTKSSLKLDVFGFGDDADVLVAAAAEADEDDAVRRQRGSELGGAVDGVGRL